MEIRVNVFLETEEENKSVDEIEELIRAEFAKVVESLINTVINQKIKATSSLAIIQAHRPGKDQA